MNKWNKLLVFVGVMSLVIFIAACGNDSANNGGDLTDTAENPPATTEPQPQESTPNGDQIVLRYANWNLGTEEENNLERQMIQAFMDAHPNIIIEIDNSITPGETHWNELLAIAASTGNLPDVFMVDDIGVNLTNGWALDISEIANADADFTALPENMQDAMSINNRVYNVPFAQHMFGYFVNLDLFDSLNLDAPTFGFSIEEFEEAVRLVTDLNSPIIGTNHIDYFIAWYPGALNANMGFLTFDGEEFNLNSPEMLNAVQTAVELSSNGFVFDELEEAQRESFNGGWGGEVFFNEQMGLLWDGTWAVGSIAEQSNFNWEFIGVPGGRPMVTTDVLNIATTTTHPEEAYLFAMWMGSGSNGFTRRMELAQENQTIVNALPITGNQTLLTTFWEMLGVPGIALAYENLDNALIDRNKITPGWPTVRHHAQTGIQIQDNDNATVGDVLHNAVRGNINFADYAARINDIMQETFEEMNNAIE